MWFEIFKAGAHTDSSGNERTWTEADLDTIVAKYNPTAHEAPVVIGHPKDNAPAFGWIEALKRDGKTLFAKAKDLVPEFKEMVNKGMFKKRSISLYPDLTLRHVGFLGAMPPAVKGLADVAFADQEGTTMEFDEGWRASLLGGIFQRIREWAIEKFGLDTADRLVAQWEIDELKKEPTADSLEGGPAFVDAPRSMLDAKPKEEDMDKIVELEGKLATLTAQLTQFSEKDKAKEAEIAALRTELDAEKKKTRAKDFESYCDTLIAAGTLTPAQKVMAINFFMAVLDGAGEYEFTEADKKVKRPPLEAFKDFLKTIPRQVEFSEVAGHGKATKTGTGSAAEKLDKITTDRMKADKTLGYSAAFSEAQRENPELAIEYAAEITQ